jgi:serine protease Do
MSIFFNIFALFRCAGLLVCLALAVPAAQAATPDYSSIIKRVYPAVVDVQLEGAQRTGAGLSQRTRSLGAGFVIDSEGVVVTNDHVVRNQTKLQVRFQNGNIHSVTVLGTDKDTDLAVLKIEDPGPYPFVRFGNSDKATMGTAVLAVGNPYGLGGTVTAGIVSARNRVIGTSVYDDFIQTDASINLGNSGGPLFNMRGEVVGVNAAMFSPPNVRANVGLGFSIPSSTARVVVDQIREFGEARRGSLGVGIDEVTKERAIGAKMGRPRGAYVLSVREGSPADLAGVVVGDIILSFNRKPVRYFRDLPRLVGVAELNQDSHMRIWRDGRSMVVKVRILPIPKAQALSSVLDERFGAPRYGELGVELTRVTPQIAVQYDLPADTEGTIVTKVTVEDDHDSALRVGDLILAVDGHAIQTPADASFALRTAHDHKEVGVKVRRGQGLRHEIITRTVKDKFK